MGDPDYCEKKCPICTKAREGNRLARFVQKIEMLLTFGGCPHGRARRNKYGVRPNELLPPSPLANASTATLEVILEEVRASADRKVKEGFDDEEMIVQQLTEQYEEEYQRHDIASHVARITKESLHNHLQAQAGWPAVTDCDKLDSAFAKLEEQGIVARQNFACCQNCGFDEIGDEISDALKVKEVKGFTFYHMQDTEGAAETGELYLAYGALSGKDVDSLAIGHAVADAIRKEGLNVDWNGLLKNRICITGLDWKRRRGDDTRARSNY